MKEYKRTCCNCGKVWMSDYERENDLVNRINNMISIAKTEITGNGLKAASNLIGGFLFPPLWIFGKGISDWANEAEKSASQVEEQRNILLQLRRCPNCGSVNCECEETDSSTLETQERKARVKNRKHKKFSSKKSKSNKKRGLPKCSKNFDKEEAQEPDEQFEKSELTEWNVIVEVEKPNLTAWHKLITCESCNNIIDIPKGSDISLEYSCPHCNKDMVIIP
jgi:predicted RNA-binding Zn-ribbon protein involved in translation (DUF1610 family)